jgi:hypothetical protein
VRDCAGHGGEGEELDGVALHVELSRYGRSLTGTFVFEKWV